MADFQTWPVYIEDIEPQLWRGVVNEDESKTAFITIKLYSKSYSWDFFFRELHILAAESVALGAI